MPDAGTVSDLLVSRLARAGVARIFGIPGGGSSLRVIDAARQQGLEFVLTRTETAAALMAAATAELTLTPGVVLTALGPGATSVINGVAHAHLDRTPLVLITDALDPQVPMPVTHQVVDQRRLFEPITVASTQLRATTAARAIDEAIAAALSPPGSPVHLELPSRVACAELSDGNGTEENTRTSPRVAETETHAAVSESRLKVACDLLRRAKRPVIIAGLDVRVPSGAGALRQLAERLACPVFTTYKAKGSIPDRHPLAVGLFTGGKAESSCIGQADLIVQFGLDPVELIPQPWSYSAPILDIGVVAGRPHYAEPAVALVGAVDQLVEELIDAARPSAWQPIQIEVCRNGMRATSCPMEPLDDGARIRADLLVKTAARIAPNARVTVDAGAHMFAAIGLWPATAPGDVLISNGLSTMGFALPAAIAAALVDRKHRVIALTGDAGLLMCIGELSTAARLCCPITVVVFNDAALSLIDIKQQALGMPTTGVRTPSADFATIAEGMGCTGFRVKRKGDLEPALEAACATEGPSLVDVPVSTTGYRAQLAALRG